MGIVNAIIKEWRVILTAGLVLAVCVYIVVLHNQIAKRDAKLYEAIQEAQTGTTYPDGTSAPSVVSVEKEKEIVAEAEKRFSEAIIRELKKRDEKIVELTRINLSLNERVGSLVANDHDPTLPGIWVFEDNCLRATVDPVERKLDYFIKSRQIQVDFLETTGEVDGVEGIHRYRVRAVDDLGSVLAVKDFEVKIPRPETHWYDGIPILRRKWGRVTLAVGTLAVAGYLLTK